MACCVSLFRGREVDSVYFSNPYYRLGLVAAVALTAISAAIAALCFTFGSSGFYALSACSGLGFVVLVVMLARGCMPKKTSGSNESSQSS